MKWTAKQLLSWFSVILLVSVIVFYAYYQSRGILEGPQITLSTPEDGITVTEPLLKVFGTARHAKALTLDGRPIFIDLTGNFYQELLLLDGYNIIELTAKDAEGRERKKTLSVYYDRQKTAAEKTGTSTAATSTTE